MANTWKNRVKFAASTSGTADFGIGAADSSFQTPAGAGYTNGQTASYVALSADHSQWEMGLGTYSTATPTWQRTTPRQSSNGNAAVNFTLPPTVFIGPLAEDFAPLVDALEFVIDGGGATITTGLKGYLEVPYACTITRASLLADQSGSIVVDIFRSTYSAFAPPTHPASADKLTASAPPTISSALKSQDSTLTGWTLTLAAGDILAFNVNSVTTIQRVTVSLLVTRT